MDSKIEKPKVQSLALPHQTRFNELELKMTVTDLGEVMTC
ncbi:hypothetical protein LASUN_19050 [Lentilactobacillus sunkii]|jgi:hypothetical protein|uniref:Uncharacterized protein n=1 Tax=Lentilactobacillus sunkii TaxID=481719 RepID=A0A1E7XB05_9LACO|nr:hypothetical protein LASUN_19050 [Lentilactobacillus sunkii]